MKTLTSPELPSRGALYGFCAPASRDEDHGDDDERIRVRASSSAAVRAPCLRLNEFIWSDVSPPSVIWERMRLLVFVTLFGVLLDAGDALQIQCYQCEEMKHNDCSTPEYIVNCTVNVQDTCQKEVLVKPDGRGRERSPSLPSGGESGHTPPPLRRERIQPRCGGALSWRNSDTVPGSR
ncbi:Ly6/PLAUR domain-containing protein 1 [Nibea albiflora]|uniref:Ly6/PLAUR domain-containing protein 1 n=1 Tax=Nibea albiflora TaxID=240163 RepID=A0ACB7EQP6_NIBAL|nr:Ly6/PLAUR domain-containing protein 1 [Nibea albiflora]